MIKLRILIKGLHQANCTYREKQNSSCFLKHSLMSSVDTVELPSPEKNQIHHQLSPSWHGNKDTSHCRTQEWIPLGRTKRKSSDSPRPQTLTMTLIPPGTCLATPWGQTGTFWMHMDKSELQLGHSTLRAAPGGVTDTESSIWTSLTRYFIDLVSQIFSCQDNSICWCLINPCAIPCGFTGWGIHHFILLAAVLCDLYVTWQRNTPAAGKLLSDSADFPFEKFWLPTLKQILKKVAPQSVSVRSRSV